MNRLAQLTASLRGFTVPALIALAIVAGASRSSPVSAAEDPKQPAKDAPAANPAPDRVVLRSGKIVDGKILEETDTQITMTVVVGGMTAKTVYPKSDILEIKRDNNLKPAGDVLASKKHVDIPEITKKKDKKADDETDDQPAVDENDPLLTRLYVVNLKGRFGFDIAKTTLVKLFEEADKELGDTVEGSGTMEGKTIIDPAKRDRNIIVLKLDTSSEQLSRAIFAAEDIAPVVKEQIVDRGRRVVFWIELAAGGAAVFPFVSPDIYFTPEGRLGGAGDLDEFDSGDHLVNEKLVSAYIAHAQGFMIKGGYGNHIPALMAMLRKQVWLFVRFEGGKPIYLDREPEEKDGPDWTMLSDDGEGDNEDEAVLIGNDLFLLEPDWAEKLGISDGTVETIDDLAFRLGVQRNYKAIEKNKGQKAVDAWKSGIDEAIKNVAPQETETRRLGKLWRDLAEVPDGTDFDDRRKNRGRKITILRQIRAIVSQYAEVFDSDGGWRSQIDVQLARHQQDAEADARANRSQNTNNNGRR